MRDLQTPRIAVIGIGNTLMGDDGVGVAVAALLDGSLPRNVDVYDAGTALQDMLSCVGRCERVILIDSCAAGGAPGTVYRSILHPDDWETAPLGDSLHDMDVVHALRMHRLAGGSLGEVALIGIEPGEVSLREGLSPALEARMPAILQAVRDEIGKARAAVGTQAAPACGEDAEVLGYPCGGN